MHIGRCHLITYTVNYLPTEELCLALSLIKNVQVFQEVDKAVSPVLNSLSEAFAHVDIISMLGWWSGVREELALKSLCGSATMLSAQVSRQTPMCA